MTHPSDSDVAPADARPADEEVALPAAPGPPRAKKPKRAWLLQAIAVFQLLAAGTGFVWTIASGAVQEAPLDQIALWLLRAASLLVPPAAMLVSLQRRLPRPDIVAPASAVVWWIHGTVLNLLTWNDPLPAALKDYDYEGPDEQLFFTVLFRIFWLYMVLSVVFEKDFRAYLKGEPASTESSA